MVVHVVGVVDVAIVVVADMGVDANDAVYVVVVDVGVELVACCCCGCMR